MIELISFTYKLEDFDIKYLPLQFMMNVWVSYTPIIFFTSKTVFVLKKCFSILCQQISPGKLSPNAGLIKKSH